MKRFAMILLFLSVSACSTALVGGPNAESPEGNFDVLWEDFDALYALFGLKEVSWDEVRERHRPAAVSAQTDEELEAVLVATMAELDDGHLQLYDPDGELIWRGSGPLEPAPIFDEAIAEAYLTTTIGRTTRNDQTQTLAGRIDDVGYLRIATWEGSGGIGTPGSWTDDAHMALDELSDVRALIIDVRSNGGGSFFNGLDVASRFVTRPTPAFTTSFRDGPDHADMSPREAWTIEPAADVLEMPVYVLVDRQCYSANEAFVLMMREAGATIVGGRTGGALGTQVRRELPNGAVFRVTVNDVRAMNGESYEERGIPVDVETGGQSEGVDPAIEYVLGEL